ncbi:hypothetical protein ACFPFQ_09930 [Pseudonocardia sp. GCM10023141]
MLIVGDFTDGSGEVVVATPGEAPPTTSTIEHERVPTSTFRSLTLWPTVHGVLHHRVLDVMVEQSDVSTSLAVQVRVDLPSTVLDEAPFDPGSELVAELRDDLARLQSAPAVPVRTAGPETRALELPGSGRQQLELLIETLGVNQNEAMELRRGRRTLTPAQAQVLETILGMRPGSLPSSAGIDPALALEIEHPRWREATRRRAARTGQDELSARVSLAADAYALAARESTTEPDWTQRIALLVAGEA